MVCLPKQLASKNVQRVFLLICFLCTLESIAQSNQEVKKLALVIGNANYDAGKLKNPVNDALLMASAFDSLGFDVILDTNIKTQTDFNLTIREFGLKRKEYDVGFVYYAGHGIQVGSENFMLPTKVNLESEDDVDYFGVNVQKIVNILIRTTDQVNVLILDACRNNPFESQWNLTRSLRAGKGLAKMQAPMGSLIAFSTTAGNVAPDGSGDNSIYCRSLYNNMFKEGLSLDQLFRNVRSEVLEASNGIQQTEESTQLTGATFYLKERDYENIYREVDSLIDAGDFSRALEVNQTILLSSDKDYDALFNRGFIYALMDENQRAISTFKRLNKIYPQKVAPLWMQGLILSNLEEYEEAIKIFRDCIAIDSNDIDFYEEIASCYVSLEKYNDALVNLSTAIALEPDSLFLHENRSAIFLLKGDTTKAINDLDSVILRDPQNWEVYNEKADLLSYLGPDEISIAVETFTYVVENCNDRYPLFRAINNRANIYNERGEAEKAVADQTFIIDNYQDTAIISPSLTYVNRGEIYENLEEYDKAISDYETSIVLDPNYARGYESLIRLKLEMGDTLAALSSYEYLLGIDYNKIHLSDRADLYLSLDEYELAIVNYERSIAFYDSIYDFTYWWNQNRRAVAYWLMDSNEKAISILNVVLEKVDSTIGDIELSKLYELRGTIYQLSSAIQKAESDFINSYSIWSSPSTAINLMNLYWEENDTINFHETSNLALSRALNAEDSLLLLEELFLVESGWEKYNRADNIARLIIKLNPSSESLSNAGFIAMVLNEDDRALRLLNEAIKSDSSNTSPLFYRSKLYEKLGESFLAVGDLQKTIKINPEDPEGYYYLANFYQKKDELLKALRNFDLAISSYVGGYYITDEFGVENIELSEVYAKRANLYKELGDYELMCEDFTKASDLGLLIAEDRCLN
jgi:tetratricopeptide (TPR) repeat protein